MLPALTAGLVSPCPIPLQKPSQATRPKLTGYPGSGQHISCLPWTATISPFPIPTCSTSSTCPPSLSALGAPTRCYPCGPSSSLPRIHLPCPRSSRCSILIQAPLLVSMSPIASSPMPRLASCSSFFLRPPLPIQTLRLLRDGAPQRFRPGHIACKQSHAALRRRIDLAQFET